MTDRKISLKVIRAPATGPVLHAPPVRVASEHSVDYTCSRCGTILLHAEENQVHGVLINCTNCGSYNSMESETLRSLVGLEDHLVRSGRGPARIALAALAIISPARRP
jgi:DNA-directed RNA polymerase subunit RPC12/RpoP